MKGSWKQTKEGKFKSYNHYFHSKLGDGSIHEELGEIQNTEKRLEEGTLF
jgi:hypothetical protein